MDPMADRRVASDGICGARLAWGLRIAALLALCFGCGSPAQAAPLTGATPATLQLGTQTLTRCGASPLSYCGRLSVPLNHQSGPHRNAFARPDCGKTQVLIGEAHRHDAVISALEPLDTMTSTFTDTYSQSAPGLQSISKFEVGGEVTFEMEFTLLRNAFRRAALTLESTVTTSEPMEIRAYVN
jgi:hypothetical protein